MSILLEGLSKSKKEITKDAISHCRSVLELDFLREDIEYVEKETDIVYGYLYSIKKLNKNKKSSELGKYSSLLFLEYPDSFEKENSINVLERDSIILLWPVSKVVTNIIKIPNFLIKSVFTPINDNTLNKDVLEIIKNSIETIQNNNYKSHFWAIYMFQYKDILNSFETKSFNNSELREIQILLNEINLLTLIIKKDLENYELIAERDSLKLINEKNIDYQNMLNSIDHIEVIISKEDNGLWINQFLDKFEVNMNGDKLNIRSEISKDMFELYSKLFIISKAKKAEISLIMLDIKLTNNSVKHIIETETSPWAYTFYRMFGEGVEYSNDKDLKVRELLEISNDLNISVEYLLGAHL